MGRRLILIAVLFALALSAGCSSAPGMSEDEKAIRATLERYNQLLTEGYRALDMNRMGEVATKLQSENEYIHMSSLAEGGVRLDPTLKKLDVLSVSIEATSATAETEETWDYRHYSRASGDLVLEETGLVYRLAWDLEKQPTGQWLVSDVRAISATSTTEPAQLGTITPTPPKKD